MLCCSNLTQIPPIRFIFWAIKNSSSELKSHLLGFKKIFYSLILFEKFERNFMFFIIKGKKLRPLFLLKKILTNIKASYSDLRDIEFAYYLMLEK